MTLFISDRESLRNYADGILENAAWCLAASALCAVFGGIYELFSHGVYSPFMLFSFMIPLVLGAGPASLIGLHVKTKAEEKSPGTMESFTGCEGIIEDINEFGEIVAEGSTGAGKEGNSVPAGICIPGGISRNAWFSGVAALTVGCIFCGILEIYGTTNRLLIVYPATAAVLMCASIAAYVLAVVTFRRAERRTADRREQRGDFRDFPEGGEAKG